jgi:2-oxo-4-hydroxy-4-carboxy-5-ureidoimidazoline decarboxylase
MQTRHTIAELNALSAEDFVRLIGPVFEHSPWIAQQASARRPSATVQELLTALCDTVRHATGEQKLALIRAHPDLVGRTVTAESSAEQAAAGLNKLTSDEVALFKQQNEAYRQKFGFPFIICARLNKKDAILAGFERRLPNSADEEMRAALEEIFKIAKLRLCDLIEE